MGRSYDTPPSDLESWALRLSPTVSWNIYYLGPTWAFQASSEGQKHKLKDNDTCIKKNGFTNFQDYMTMVALHETITGISVHNTNESLGVSI